MFRKSIRYILIILATGLLLAILYDAFLQAGFKKTKEDEVGKLNAIINDSAYFNVVCFGSSRALAHFDPILFEHRTGMTAYNAGFNGAAITDMHMLFKAYLKKHKAPRIVVLHFDDFTLETEKIVELPRYFPFIDDDEIYDAIRPLQKEAFYVRHLPFLRIMYYSDLIKWTGMKPFLGLTARGEYALHNGYVSARNDSSYWTSYLEDHVNDRIREVSAPPLKPSQLKKGAALLKDIFITCRKLGVHIVATSSPITYGRLDLKYQATQSLVEQLAIGYDVDFYWSHAMDINPRPYFYDYSHMSCKGAKLYTGNLADFILSSENKR